MIMEIEELLLRYALSNAVQHSGKALKKAVLGRIAAEHPELRPRMKEISSLADSIIEKVNSMSLEEQRRLLEERFPNELERLEGEKEAREVEKGLPPLPEADRFDRIVLRLAPSPSGPLHIGHARMVILNDEYRRMYDGKLILRFEDTDPRKVLPEAYDMIEEDLEWLGIEYQEVYYQSDRLEIYYEHARKLIEMGKAYVCTCSPEEIWERTRAGIACDCRKRSPEENLDLFQKMLDGYFREKEAIVRIKTDLKHPMIDVRDWSALRIVEHPHPRVDARVWPFMNFAVAIDDHLMGLTHVLRGKDHERNTIKQLYIFDYFGWEKPVYIHYGKLVLEGLKLSTSRTKEMIARGELRGWDDPRSGTLISLRKRGFQPEAIREVMIDLGIKPADVTLSWKNLYAANRKLVDPIAPRFFFVPDPIELLVLDLDLEEVEARIPLHPNRPEMGFRTIKVRSEDGRARLLISRDDLKLMEEESRIRLKDLFNIEIIEISENRVEARFAGRELVGGLKKIQWLPVGEGVETRVLMPDGSIREGLAERRLEEMNPGSIVQFERFGFARIDSKEDGIFCYYAHP